MTKGLPSWRKLPLKFNYYAVPFFSFTHSGVQRLAAGGEPRPSPCRALSAAAAAPGAHTPPAPKSNTHKKNASSNIPKKNREPPLFEKRINPTKRCMPLANNTGPASLSSICGGFLSLLFLSPIEFITTSTTSYLLYLNFFVVVVVVVVGIVGISDQVCALSAGRALSFSSVVVCRVTGSPPLCLPPILADSHQCPTCLIFASRFRAAALNARPSCSREAAAPQIER